MVEGLSPLLASSSLDRLIQPQLRSVVSLCPVLPVGTWEVPGRSELEHDAMKASLQTSEALLRTNGIPS